MKDMQRKNESGNVLFLILIAVALFAALSYAVTQSSRSGAGDASDETSLINSAQVSQYPSSVRTSIVRMLISDNIETTELLFDPPPYAGLTTDALKARGVFYTTAGGATYTNAPKDVIWDGSQTGWIFSSDYKITNIGTDANDIIAFLPGLKPSVCKKINKELGIPSGTDTDGDTVPTGATTKPDFATNNMDAGDAGIGSAANAAHTIGNTAFDGQPFGCFDTVDGTTTDGDLVYYHVLVER